MAFTIANWACISSSLNQGQEIIGPTTLNAPNIFMYGSPTDTVATIEASNYFLSQYASLDVGDWILGYGTDASFSLQVTAVSSTSVTTQSTGLTSNIGTANIQDGAVTTAKLATDAVTTVKITDANVTYAKIQNANAQTLLGNPENIADQVSEIVLGNGLEFSLPQLRIPFNFLIHTSVNISAAEFNGMYGAPKLLIAAGGANSVIVVDKIVILLKYGTVQFAAGGLVVLQYDSTVHGAGTLAGTTIQASDFTGATSSTAFFFNGPSGNSSQATYSTSNNKGVYLSNQSGAFTTGDSTMVAQIWYKIVATT